MRLVWIEVRTAVPLYPDLLPYPAMEIVNDREVPRTFFAPPPLFNRPRKQKKRKSIRFAGRRGIIGHRIDRAKLAN